MDSLCTACGAELLEDAAFCMKCGQAVPTTIAAAPLTIPHVVSMEERAKRVDLVFEGGGVKGIGLLGACSVLEERGFHFHHLAGTSAGAIVATLLAAGYTTAELQAIMAELDFRQFMDRGDDSYIPFLGTTFNVLRDEGLYEGERFLEWISDLLLAKGVRTFGDLTHPDSTEQELRYHYRLQVIASDLTQRCLLILPRDAHSLGVEPDMLNVALAVRMSMSIPVFFEPVRFRNPETGREHIIVDGGILSNFPVWLFDCGDEEPEHATFGLRLIEPDPAASLADRIPDFDTLDGVMGIVHYLRILVETMTAAHDRMYLAAADFARTIGIPTLGIRTTEFGLSHERSQALFEAGRAAAETFLKDWSFETYLEQYRCRRSAATRREPVEP